MTEQIEITQCARSLKFFKKGRNEKKEMKEKKSKAKSKKKVQQSTGESKEWSRGRELIFLIA